MVKESNSSSRHVAISNLRSYNSVTQTFLHTDYFITARSHEDTWGVKAELHAFLT